VVAGELHGAHVVDRPYAGDGQLRWPSWKYVYRIAKAPQLVGADSSDRIKACGQPLDLSVKVAEYRQTHV
jgi:hypothetical protein